MQEIEKPQTEKRMFRDIFKSISINESHEDFFNTAVIENMDYYKNSNELIIRLESDIEVPVQVLENIEEQIRAGLGASYVEIIVPDTNQKYPFHDNIERYKERIIRYVGSKFAMTKPALLNSNWEVSEKEVIINLPSSAEAFLKQKNCDKLIEKFLQRNFNYNCKIRFTHDNGSASGNEEEYLAVKEEIEKGLVKEVLKENSSTEKENKKKAKKPVTVEKSGSSMILGKPFKDEIINISDISIEIEKAVVEGRILCVETRNIKNGKVLVSFDIYDKTSSITVKLFIQKEKLDGLLSGITVDKWVRVRGSVQYDKFSREITMMASSIIEVTCEEKKDNAEVKRVELHLHTQMSSMDAVTPVDKLVKRAAQWGHKAIAITDHGVVQAFPEAYTAGKKNNIKIIFGIECYLVDDKVPAVKKPQPYTLDGEYVVLDIETTGLNPIRDRITEIGAVKIRDGKITDKYNKLINPGVTIPAEITQITGIDDNMVKDAPKVSEVLPDFMQFIGNAPVIAHNAVFDMGFINQAAKELQINIPNTVIDTLILSRILMPKLERHKLIKVAEGLGIEVKNAHRASDDALTAALIWNEFIRMMKERGIENLTEIDKVLNSEINVRNTDSFHAVILVKNKTGLKNLYKIVTESHLKYYYKKPRVPKSLYVKYSEGLMIGTACEAGELFSAILNKKSDAEINRIVKFYDYLEIQPLGNNEFLVRDGRVNEKDLIDINKKIIKLGEKYNKPVAATCDTHFMDEEDEVYRRILMAGQGYNDADNQAPLYFRTTEEMLKEFDYLDSQKAYEIVVENTNMIADMIENIEPIPQKTFPPKIEGAEEEFERLSVTKAKEIYGDPLPEIVQKRLDKELNSIIKNGFSVMFMIAQKLVSKSLGDGYLVGSRGSVGSSFAATMAGITEVNSLPAHYVCKECRYSEFPEGVSGCGVDMAGKDCPKCGKPLHKDGYDIPFETFLGFEGDKEPDIDLNFSGDYQPRAHKYIEELFGEGHVFRAGTIATIADKTAYGFVKNYLADRNINVYNAEINRLVRGCTGIKKTTGQHPGGVMIVPQDNEIFEFCPVQRPADDEGSNIITTHFDYHSIHGTLLKLDILGHDDPTVIRMLEDLTGLDARKIQIGDKATMSIFTGTESLGIKKESINSEVGTFGIPEFGTRFVRQMLVDTKPTTFSELVKISGLSHGTDVWLNNAQDIIRSGTAKLSEVICTRDDIMLYLIKMGLEPKMSFKIMEDVRKGKGLKPEYEEAMQANNVPDWYIQSCNKIKYMFPKAHAVAYVMMAFRIAYFKVHYPEAFYIAYFTVRADDFDAELMTNGPDKIKRQIKDLESKGNSLTAKEKNILTILEVANEMYQRDIKFLPVDLYKSDSAKFLLEDGGVRPPLASLQGLGNVAAQNIVEARNREKFLSKDDVRIKSKVSKAVIEILENYGCLKDMPESNQMSLF